MEPHSEHSGASVVMTLKGNCCCGLGSVGRSVMLSPASLTAYSGYMAFEASGLRKAEMARRMGISKVNVDRLFDLTHHSRLDQIEAAFQALGKQLAIEIRDAA